MHTLIYALYIFILALSARKDHERAVPTNEPHTTVTSSTDPTTTQESDSTSSSSETSTPPVTDNGSRTSIPGTGSTVSEHSSEQDEEPLVKDVGIGLGTIVGLVLVAFVVVAVVAVYLIRRSRNRHRQELTQERYKGAHPPLRSLSSPTPPLTPLKSNIFYLPTKQSNVTQNNVPPPVKNTEAKQVVNQSPSVNEFVEEPEPEMYELESVRPRRPKRLSTPPESSPLKPEKPIVCDLETVVTCIPGSGNVTVATIDCTEEKKDELSLHNQKPTRSCLSSVFDSSKLGRTVSFVEDGSGDTDTLPPPLSPKTQVSIKSGNSFSYEGKN